MERTRGRGGSVYTLGQGRGYTARHPDIMHISLVLETVISFAKETPKGNFALSEIVFRVL